MTGSIGHSYPKETETSYPAAASAMGADQPGQGHATVNSLGLSETQRQEFSRPSTYTFDDAIPPESSDHPQPSGDRFVFSGCTYFLLFIAAAVLIAAVVTSPRPFYTLLFVILAFLPAVPVARFILRNFQDSAVSKSFLLTQFLLGAVPLIIVAGQVELVLTVIFAIMVFRSELAAAKQALSSIQGATSSTDQDKADAALQALLKVTPLWKVLIFFLLVAFITAGLVEEAGKWFVARRYRKLDNAEDSSSARIGCRGILASACASALGFAMTENVGYVLGIANANRTGFSFGLVGLALLRGILAYPVHVGTQFYVGVSAARWHVLGDRASVAWALFVAVLFHGTFDAVAFICMVLVGLKRIPEWVGAFVPVFDVVLVGFLLLLCRGRYTALLQRERVLMVTDPV